MKTKTPKNLPSKLLLDWKTDKNDLPTDLGIYAVCCRNKKTKEEWFSFAEFVPMRLPNCKVDFDEWRVCGTIYGTSFARGSTDNWFDVIAWSKTMRK